LWLVLPDYKSVLITKISLKLLQTKNFFFAARVFRMAADFVMDDGSGSSGESFSGDVASSANGRNGSTNGGSGYGVNELPEMYQFSATSSAERAVAAAAAWEQGLRGQEGTVSSRSAHYPLLSQVS
jgi:hypothetical protein